VGFTAFVLLIPLALTSTQASIRRLGKRWQMIHRLIYVTAVLGVIHYIWLVKKDIRKPAIYASILAVLFAYRFIIWAWARITSPASAQTASIAGRTIPAD
jgi:sulfoxide reductase heme-binding subunit YedZ